MKIKRKINHEHLNRLYFTETWADVYKASDSNIAAKDFMNKIRKFIEISSYSKYIQTLNDGFQVKSLY